MLTADRLKVLVNYDAESGVFTRLVSTRNATAGKQTTGTMRPDGYLVLNVDGKQYLCHRLAWLYMHGEWPLEHTDHIDGNRTNNRIANLRAASAAENGRNRTRSQAKNTSGSRGVYWSSIRRKWIAQICVDRKVINLGGFAEKEAAVAARQAAETTFHGSFRGQP